MPAEKLANLFANKRTALNKDQSLQGNAGSKTNTVEFAYNGTSGGFLKPAVIAEFTL